MSIDLDAENLLPISKVAESLPNRPHIATVWRWVYTGIKGHRLATIRLGGRVFTSTEALQRFIEATTAAADRQQGAAHA